MGLGLRPTQGLGFGRGSWVSLELKVQGSELHLEKQAGKQALSRCESITEMIPTATAWASQAGLTTGATMFRIVVVSEGILQTL